MIETTHETTITTMSEGTLTVNIHNLRNSPGHMDVHRLDRQSGSPLANPYWMRDEDHREWACVMFARALNEGRIKLEAFDLLDSLAYELRVNQTLHLACWCAPKQCHTESVARELLHLLRDTT